MTFSLLPKTLVVGGTFLMKEKKSFLILPLASMSSFTLTQIISRQFFTWLQNAYHLLLLFIYFTFILFAVEAILSSVSTFVCDFLSVHLPFL